MPYMNMPRSMWGKMDDCVTKVQAQGHDKQSAIAICYVSLMGKEKNMDEKFKASDQPGDYLIVEDREKPTTWHLQVRDNGTPDHRLMGAAHAALMSPNGYRGNKYEGPNKTEAIAKLKKLYDSEGMAWPEGKEQKDMGMMSDAVQWMPFSGATTIADALAQEQAQEQAAELQDAFGTFQGVVNNIMASPDVPDKGAAIEKEAGAFRQLFDSILSGAQNAVKQLAEKVGARHSSTDRDHLQTIHDASLALGAACKTGKASAFTLFKDAADKWRWVAIATNNRRDSDHPAQILTDAAHKEFLQYLDVHPGAMPELWHWHTPGTKWGRADIADYAEGFVIYAGTVDAGHEAEAEKLAKQTEIGVSHGFVVLDHDVANEHINQYRTFEVSPLPLSAAANRWTNFQTIHKEVSMPFSEQKRSYLVGLLGEERVKQLETDLSAANKTLDAVGIEAKEDKPPEATPPGVKPEGEPDEPKKAWFLADMEPEEFKALLQGQVKPMLEEMQKANVIATVTATKQVGDQLSTQLAEVVKAQSALDARLKELEGLTPKGYRASKDGPEPDKAKADKTAPGPDGKANDFIAFVLGGQPQP